MKNLIVFFQLGINAAFDEGEFTNIIEDNPLKVSQIKHRATIEVTWNCWGRSIFY